MSEALLESVTNTALARAHQVVDDLLGAELTRPSDAELLTLHRDLERLRNRLAAVEHTLIAEEETRSLPATHGARTTAGFLRGLLRLHPGEAAGRVRAAHAAGPRRSVGGQPLPARYPQLAVGQAEGAVSARQAQVIVATIEKLPDPVRDQHGTQIEGDLVEHAATFDPLQLDTLGRRIRDWYDPDGILHDAQYRERVRDFTLQVRADGSSTGHGELTAELTEHLLVHFDALAGPAPETDGVKDPRTAGARRHDALLAALTLNERAQLLPAVAGITATLIVTMTEHAYRTGHGLATTSHGALIPAPDALRWAGGDHRLFLVALNSMKAVTAYGSTHRLFTENQRLALTARDRGCTFPGCDTPPSQCETHHLIPYTEGGPTTLANATLLCAYNHHQFQHQGWQAKIINGRVGWLPPPWIDPEQRPRFNTMHRPALE